MKVLITGGNGFIAKNIKNYLGNLYTVDTITRQDFDLIDTEKVNKFFSDKFYDVIIHTAIIGGSRLRIDSPSIVYDNIKMLYNILENKAHYKRLINLGSGAEKVYSKTPYGMSKSIIFNIINNLDNHYNLRVYAVFNENELETRFIKSNIIRYINKEPIVIHQDKYMDFFYMKDLCRLVHFYISSENAPKVSECSYPKKYLLSEIADIINGMSTYKVPVIIEQGSMGENYIGSNGPDIDFIGLEQGIYNTYNALRQNIG
jgi:nucleoside-diphosphate-sugar epimerase